MTSASSAYQTSEGYKCAPLVAISSQLLTMLQTDEMDPHIVYRFSAVLLESHQALRIIQYVHMYVLEFTIYTAEYG